MIFALFESRVVDVLLIVAAVYFLFPNLFRGTRQNPSSPKNNISVNQQAQHKSKSVIGEYIDFEEVKS